MYMRCYRYCRVLNAFPGDAPITVTTMYIQHCDSSEERCAADNTKDGLNFTNKNKRTIKFHRAIKTKNCMLL